MPDCRCGLVEYLPEGKRNRLELPLQPLLLTWRNAMKRTRRRGVRISGPRGLCAVANRVSSLLIRQFCNDQKPCLTTATWG